MNNVISLYHFTTKENLDKIKKVGMSQFIEYQRRLMILRTEKLISLTILYGDGFNILDYLKFYPSISGFLFLDLKLP